MSLLPLCVPGIHTMLQQPQLIRLHHLYHCFQLSKKGNSYDANILPQPRKKARKQNTNCASQHQIYLNCQQFTADLFVEQTRHKKHDCVLQHASVGQSIGIGSQVRMHNGKQNFHVIPPKTNNIIVICAARSGECISGKPQIQSVSNGESEMSCTQFCHIRRIEQTAFLFIQGNYLFVWRWKNTIHPVHQNIMILV